MTDPNGDSQSVSYDELGRAIAFAQGGAPAHLHVAYDLSAPRPRVTSYTFDGAAATLPMWASAWTAGGPWRQSVAVSNGAGEPLYAATRVGDAQWIIGGFVDRDARGRVVNAYQPFYSDSATPAAVLAGT